jgi:hypothetical protein
MIPAGPAVLGLLAYLDPGPPSDSHGGIGPLEIGLTLLFFALLGLTIYAAVRLANRKRN